MGGVIAASPAPVVWTPTTHFYETRSSDVSTNPRQLNLSTFTAVTGRLEAMRAVCLTQNGGTFTKIRMQVGGTSWAAATGLAFRMGVWALDGTKLGETADSGTLLAAKGSNEVLQLSLAASVSLTEKQHVWLGLLFIWTGGTPGNSRGPAWVQNAVNGPVDVGSVILGWAMTGQTNVALPALSGTSRAANTPWVELVP